MLNVLVTGSNGQLGLEIEELTSLYPYNFIFTCKKRLDLRDASMVYDFFEQNAIDVIINCGAYTAVDKAQSEAKEADAINHQATRFLATLAKERGIKLIHISTDYVFDGMNHKPYVESDPTHPQSIYGQSKCEGEKAMLEINPENSIIIRTSWVYSSYGANFLKTMLRLGRERESLGVVFDQVGTPTYAHDLAQMILTILPQISNQDVEIFHYSNEGVLSWYDFAKEIMKMAKISCVISPIETSAYPTPAKRPHYSVLNKAKIKSTYGITIPFWKDSLDACLKKMGERK